MTRNKGYDEKLVEELKELDAWSLEKLHPTENAGEVVELDSHRIAWKGASHNTVLRLIIPEGSQVVFPNDSFSPATVTKLRTDRAFVDEIRQVRGLEIGSTQRTQVRSKYVNSFKYREGEIVTPTYFDRAITIVCTDGLHIFADRNHAEKWAKYA